MSSVAPRGRAARLTATFALAAGVLALAAGAAPALAAVSPPPVTGDVGYVRLAHLSPDTASVDVHLASASGGPFIIELDAVGYGVVSDYMRIAPGEYAVGMIPAGSPDDATPLVKTSVTIEKDKAVTVAAFGENSDLQTRVYQDDLTAPPAGSARIRLVQASSVTDTVDVQTSTGILIASGARAGDASTYATVAAGPWDLQLTAEGVDDTASVTLADGSVNTLFVLDNASGGLTVKSVMDSVGVGTAPVGGMQTGGGAAGHAFPALVGTGSLR